MQVKINMHQRLIEVRGWPVMRRCSSGRGNRYFYLTPQEAKDFAQKLIQAVKVI